MKQKEILLFGATGQIGRNLIRKLSKNNYKIIRFEVSFKKRYYGQSSWNINWLSKIKFIARTVKFTFKLILKINFSNKLNYRI